MKRLIMRRRPRAVAGAGAASAQTSHKKGFTIRKAVTQRNVRLRSDAPLPNADLKYGPYPEYPQSPPAAATDAQRKSPAASLRGFCLPR